jgi:hypothetical protein
MSLDDAIVTAVSREAGWFPGRALTDAPVLGDVP